jgi:hypothetical protein
MIIESRLSAQTSKSGIFFASSRCASDCAICRATAANGATRTMLPLLRVSRRLYAVLGLITCITIALKRNFGPSAVSGKHRRTQELRLVFSEAQQHSSTCNDLRTSSSRKQQTQKAAATNPLLEALQKQPWFTESTCTHWAVVRTLTAPTAAVRAVSKWSDKWCLLLVADRSSLSAQQYMPHIDKGIYLTLDLQEQLATVSTFIAKLPWNHISRKNVGYLIALLHGAEAVWDFDGSIVQTETTTTTALTTAISSNSMSWVTDITAQETVTVQQLCANVTAVANSFELVGVSTEPAWPRGFPVQQNKDTGIADALLACSELTEVT